MSEVERARERLDFEAAADALTKSKSNAEDCLQTNQQSIEFFRAEDERFILSVGLVGNTSHHAYTIGCHNNSLPLTYANCFDLAL